jgi:hypothetical protein
MHRAGLFPGAARCDILRPNGARKQIPRGRNARTKAAPLQVLPALRALVADSPTRRNADTPPAFPLGFS